jgi:methyl-accepting chemotaxis protein PixJ
MTQIPSKPTSQADKNGRSPSSKSLHIEGRTAATHSPLLLLPLLSSPEQKAIKSSTSKQLEPRTQTQGGPLQLLQPNRWRLASLRNKATALAIALGTVPVLLTGVTSYYFANQGITEQISSNKISRAVGAEDKVKRFMRERYGDIQSMSRRNFLTNATVNKTIPLAEQEEELNNLIKDYRVYDLISVADLQGNVILKSKSDPLPNQSDREYFQAVLKTDQPVISNPILPKVSANPEVPIINIAAPVKDSVTGKTIAIIRARMPVDKHWMS